MLTTFRKRFGMVPQTPPNQQNMDSSSDPYEIHRPEGRLVPTDNKKKYFLFISSLENLASIPAGRSIQKSVQIEIPAFPCLQELLV